MLHPVDVNNPMTITCELSSEKARFFLLRLDVKCKGIQNEHRGDGSGTSNNAFRAIML
jgi:hypothetical protein